MRKNITQEELHNVLIYNKLTGHFYWLYDNKRNGIKASTKAGTINSDGYIMITIDCKLYYAHRLAWLYTYGYFPEHQIDHINKIKHDNKIENLRESNHSCNARNTKTYITNTSGVKGVVFDKRNQKWKAQIVVNYKAISLGRFVDFDEAVCLRLAAEQCLNWHTCDTDSSAYRYVKEHISGK